MENRILHTLLPRAGLLVLMTFLAYAPVVQNGFVWDDDDYLTENRLLDSSAGLKRIWTEPEATPQYYPIVHTTFWIEKRLWGLNPAGYHLVNVLLHALGAVLFWRVLVALGIPCAWLAAGLFALHPVQVESVAWITERKNTLSGVFYFASALACLRWYELADQRATGARRWAWYVLGLALFTCALLSKTVTCSLPAALLLIRWWKQGRIQWRDVSCMLPFFALGIGLGLHTAWLETHHVGARGDEWALSFADRCLIAGRALWFYAGKLVWPVNLTFIYPRWNINAGEWWQWLFPIAALAVLGLLWGQRNRIGRGPLVAALFFCGTLFPALGFINVYPMRYSFVADHFQYLACAGLMVPAAFLLRRAHRHLGIPVLIVLGLVTWQQVRVYNNLETLWTHTITKNPAAWMAHNNLGMSLVSEGKLDQGIYHFQRALELKPDDAEFLANLSGAFFFKRDFEKALIHARAAVAANAGYAEAHANLGNALAAVGRLDEAIAEYRRAMELKPRNAAFHKGLGTVFVGGGRIEEAMEQFQLALEMDPDDAAAHDSAGSLLAMQGKFEEALDHFAASVRIQPDRAQVRFNYGNALALRGDFPAAVQQYEAALKLSPNHAPAHKNLGLAFIRMGRLPEAQRHLAEALRLDPSQTQARQALESITK
ncbi:MAG TPA: tetratricopeptide repeat protein [Verrucomicrobiota bacterium]|nr:tetratricopeptide repeat protein [Verrucomicrobiota bacterium]